MDKTTAPTTEDIQDFFRDATELMRQKLNHEQNENAIEAKKDYEALKQICDLADAIYNDIRPDENLYEIFNIAAERVGITRRLPDEPDFDEST